MEQTPQNFDMKLEKVYLPQVNLYAIRPRIGKLFFTSVAPSAEDKNNLVVNLDEWNLNWN